jgi:signal peptidase II
MTASRRWWAWLLLSAAIIVLDQTTKLAVRSVFHTGDEQPITGFFSLTLAFNTGAAFSFMRDAGVWPRYLFSAVALAAAVLIIWLLRRGGDRWYCAGLALILGGAVGNLWDRIALDTSWTFRLFPDAGKADRCSVGDHLRHAAG